MKLDGDEVANGHGGTEGDAVAGLADDMPCRSGIGIIGMNEVELRLTRDVPEDRMFSRKGNAVPTHVGDFQRPSLVLHVRWKTPHPARDQPQAGSLVLFAVIENDLGPQADPQEGFSTCEPILDPPVQAPVPQVLHGVAGGPDAGEDGMAGLSQNGRVVRNPARLPDIIEGAGHAG